MVIDLFAGFWINFGSQSNFKSCVVSDSELYFRI